MKRVAFIGVLLAVCWLLMSGCGKRTVQSVSQNAQPVAETPKPAPIRVSGTACKKLDSLIVPVLTKHKIFLYLAMQNTLSKGHRRPSPDTRVSVKTDGLLEGKGTLGAAKAGCAVAVFLDAGEPVEIQMNADGADAKLISPLTGAVARFLSDLTIPGTTVKAPAGTTMRREATEWVTIDDPEADSRLDAIE